MIYNDSNLLESLVRKYGKAGIRNAINRLNEISIADKYEIEKNQSKRNFSFKLFDKLCRLDPTTKNNKVGKLSNWILAKYDPSVNLDELKIALEWYADGIKRNILQREGISPDINKYKSYNEFLSALYDKMNNGDVEMSNSELQHREKLDGQFEIVGSTSKFDIIKPLTYKAERYFGSGTKWCTVANKSYFDSYMKKSPLYIVYPKDGDSKYKMQFHEQSESFADKDDIVYKTVSNCIFSLFDEGDKDAIELRNLCKKMFKHSSIGMNTDEKIESLRSLREIPREYFYESMIKGAIIPNNITKIGSDAFKGCKHLTDIIISDRVTSIAEFAFAGCTSLTNVTIPDSVTLIERGAFQGCSGLTSVSIGNRVTKIGMSVFSYCANLTSITIPDSVTEIGRWAFANCESLKSIKCPKHLADKLESEYPDIKIIITNKTNENMKTRRNNDRMLLESLVRKYGKNAVKNAIKNINESLSGSDYVEVEQIIRVLVDNQAQLNKLINKYGEPTREFERILNVYDEYVLDVFYDILESDDYEWTAERAKRMAEDNEWENGTEASMIVNFLTDIADEINININENDNVYGNNKLNESTFTDAVNTLKNEQHSFIHYLIYLNSKDNKIHAHIAGSDDSEDYIASNIDDALRIIYQNDPTPKIEIVNSLRALYI